MSPTETDIFQAIRSAQTRRELWKLLLDHFHAEGVLRISYHATAADGSTAGFAIDGFPEDWVDHYVSDNLVRVDPIPDLAARLSEPFYWHDVRNLAELTAANLEFLDELEAANVGDGLAFYVFGPNLQNAFVSLGYGEQPLPTDKYEIFTLQCVAQAGHLRYCAIEDHKGQVTGPKLSRRETEVLEWVAQGKSNSVISQLLGLSPHTVDTHMRRIYEKLHVADRTSAAIKGVGSGLVQYPQSNVA